MQRTFVLALGAGLLTVACTPEAPAPEAMQTEVPEELRQARRPVVPADEQAEGTPMAERVAIIGLLNKRNNLTQDLEMKPGEARRVGDVIVRMEACERTAPWEMPKETGAFVQVLVQEARQQGQFRRVFSGWLFKNSPSLNVVEHPIYDVWVKDCVMEFPGEEGAPAANTDDEGAAPAPAPRASPTATATATPAPQPSATASPESDATD